ncbi:SDR family oxidoreductase [Telmatospirillum sp.]|uniref:SDR family oxidoreductase n=1 Tax=Telmatospirillum sp. TaxID=2079197 RepID=UPI00284BB263|nr:SDR family oxidoreductase [Telmatospirillum sp.]MDR3435531.1 SDR family oxidoreductase [Telmatospirillum sp.]
MDLVVGATGYLGSTLCRALRAKGRNVRGLVRRSSDPAKVAALRDAGVETVIGDLKDPASLATACNGVPVVLSTASSTLSHEEGDTIESVDRQGQLSLIEAAKAAGVGHFIFVSFPEDSTSFPLQDAKRSVETALRHSGMDFTILHPTHFREIWLSPALGFNPAEGRVRIFGDGKGTISWVGLEDVAAAAVAALDNPKALNRTFPLGGRRSLSMSGVVELLEKTAGRSFEREIVPLADLQAMIRADDPLTRSFGALMLICAGHDWTIDSRDAEDALGFQPSPIESHIADLLASNGSVEKKTVV